MVAVSIWPKPEKNRCAETAKNDRAGHQDANSCAPKIQPRKVEQGLRLRQACLSFVISIKPRYGSPSADKRNCTWNQESDLKRRAVFTYQSEQTQSGVDRRIPQSRETRGYNCFRVHLEKHSSVLEDGHHPAHLMSQSC